MKETKKIINQIKAWLKAEGTDRASVVLMADSTTNELYLLTYGTLTERAHLVYCWMNADKEVGHAIYTAACHYAHKHIEAKERKRINADASAMAAEDE